MLARVWRKGSSPRPERILLLLRRIMKRSALTHWTAKVTKKENTERTQEDDVMKNKTRHLAHDAQIDRPFQIFLTP